MLVILAGSGFHLTIQLHGRRNLKNAEGISSHHPTLKRGENGLVTLQLLDILMKHSVKWLISCNASDRLE